MKPSSDPKQRASPDSAAVVLPLGAAPDIESLLMRWAQLPHCLLLDSVRRDPVLGRYSFLAADPFEYFEVLADGSDGLAEVEGRMARFQAPTLSDLPPFQGGAAGLLSYDLGRSLEKLPLPAHDEFRVPALAIGLYDVVLAIDHVENRAWLISQGFPELETGPRRRRAEQRLAQFRAILEGPVPTTSPVRAAVDRLHFDHLAPQFAVRGPAELTSNLSPADYLAAVARAIEYIRAGDIFQVNIAQRLLHPAHDDALNLYVRLRRRNPATFAGYFDLGPTQIVSASPERFLQVRGGQVEARPIKGTRQRTSQPEADLYAGDELLESEKDRAENVMIVDLLRNDLSRVCQPESVRVTQLCRIEASQYVQHLVSAVCGTLRPGLGALDMLRAAFPGGSITGAPKVRAMEIIAELEPTARGPYCGALGYLGFDGSLDTSILIRTFTAARGWWQAPVGGGIVAQSTPAAEYEETWHKASGLIRSLR